MERSMTRWRARLASPTVRNSGLALVDQAAVSGTSFITTVMVGRFAGPEQLGLYSLGMTLAILIASAQESLVSLPYTIHANRLSPQREDDPRDPRMGAGTGDETHPSATDGIGSRRAYAGSVLVLHGGIVALAAAICATIGAVAGTRAGPPGLPMAFWMLSIVIPFFLLREFARRFMFAHLHMDRAVLLDMAVAGLQIAVLVLLAATARLSAATAYAALGSACAIGGLTWLALARRNFRVAWRPVPDTFRRHWTFGAWVFAGRVVGILNSDVLLLWLLAFLVGQASAGVFAACMTIVLFSNPFILGAGNIVTPRIARAYADGGRAEVRQAVWRATIVIAAIMGGFTLLVFFFGGNLMHALYGTRYAGYERTVVVLALGVLVSGAGLAPANGLWTMNRPDLNFKACVLGLIVTLVTTAILVLPLNVLGAAIGLLTGLVADVAVRCLLFDRISRSPEDGERALNGYPRAAAMDVPQASLSPAGGES